MQTFLEKVADEILVKYRNSLSRLCIVFPSRRAGIFFKKYLSERIDKPVWSPAVCSVEDFIQGLSPYIAGDKLTLVFELFDVCKNHGLNETFERFYPWGEIILRDFDEADKNLVDASLLFRYIKEFRDIEEKFPVLFSDFEEFRKFWETFSKTELTKLQKEFVKTWEILGKVYADFRKRLADKNLAYEGMVYRSIYEKVKRNDLIIDWDKIIFTGFNALTKCEEGIFKELIKLGKAEMYWDADQYYIKDKKQEAGRFLRENFANFKETKWIENNIAEQKTIKIIGAPLKAGQVKALGNELEELIKSENLQLEKTAIVLPDENLLLPLLYSLPDDIESLNVTMGFPLRNTPLYNLIELLRNLQKNKKGEEDSAVFYHQDVIQILMHPYIKFYNSAYAYEIVNYVKKNNIIYVSRSKILKNDSAVPYILTLIFKPVSTIDEAFNYISDIIGLIAEKTVQVSDNSTEFARFELEYIYHLYKQLNLLQGVIQKYSHQLTRETFWQLLIEVLNTVRIPFTGEPLKGLQIMGLLETRAIDFENVFILSMNEGIMPRNYSHNSFIPYHLRRAFKMHTYEDEDSISAYYFYRLFQRAKNIYLFYNTEVDDFASGEKSRYLLQVENELSEGRENIKYEHKVVTYPLENHSKLRIAIEKTDEVISKLQKIKSISTSSLTSFINCPLQFYFKKAAELKEEEIIEEFFSPATFGNILHKVVQLLYNEYKGQPLNSETIDKIKKKLDENYDELLNEAFMSIEGLKENDSELYGRNLLFKGVIKKLVDRILENDRKELPFKIIDLESKAEQKITIELNGQSSEIHLSGRIDRVEEKDNTVRIIDYKTGKFEPRDRGKKSLEEYLDKVFEDPDFKEVFQAYFYSYLYSGNHPGINLNAGIYPVRKISGGVKFLNEGPITKDELVLFEKKLKELIGRIFDKNEKFYQTDDVKRCTYCSYKNICYR